MFRYPISCHCNFSLSGAAAVPSRAVTGSRVQSKICCSATAHTRARLNPAPCTTTGCYTSGSNGSATTVDSTTPNRTIDSCTVKIPRLSGCHECNSFILRTNQYLMSLIFFYRIKTQFSVFQQQIILFSFIV